MKMQTRPTDEVDVPDADPGLERSILDRQREHWTTTFAAHAEMFGATPSAPAQAAVGVFLTEGKTELLELGAGQGRDALFFAPGAARPRSRLR
jgi:hypothetical protein